MLGLFVTRPGVRVLAPPTSCGHQPEVSLCVPAGPHSDSDACLWARSRRDAVRTIERVEVTIGNLLLNTNTPSRLENRPLHLSPLAHLGFENPLEGSEINHPDLIYHLIRRDEMPVARVSLPSPHTPKFRFKSGFKTSAYVQPRLYGSLPLISPRLLQHLFPRTHQVRRLLAREP